MSRFQPPQPRSRAPAEAPKRAAPPPAEPAPAPETPPDLIAIAPHDWVKGQLLNVRHAGAGYRVTLLGEEYDPRAPERCLEFSNGFEAQKFVSQWYARENSDPRAF